MAANARPDLAGARQATPQTTAADQVANAGMITDAGAKLATSSRQTDKASRRSDADITTTGHWAV